MEFDVSAAQLASSGVGIRYWCNNKGQKNNLSTYLLTTYFFHTLDPIL